MVSSALLFACVLPLLATAHDTHDPRYVAKLRARHPQVSAAVLNRRAPTETTTTVTSVRLRKSKPTPTANAQTATATDVSLLLLPSVALAYTQRTGHPARPDWHLDPRRSNEPSPSHLSSWCQVTHQGRTSLARRHHRPHSMAGTRPPSSCRLAGSAAMALADRHEPRTRYPADAIGRLCEREQRRCCCGGGGSMLVVVRRVYEGDGYHFLPEAEDVGSLLR